MFNLFRYAGLYKFPKGAIFGYTHSETFESNSNFIEREKAETYGDVGGMNHMKALKANVPYNSWTWIYDLESGRLYFPAADRGKIDIPSEVRSSALVDAEGLRDYMKETEGEESIYANSLNWYRHSASNAGWILPDGEVVNVSIYDHAPYVIRNPAKFNISLDFDFDNCESQSDKDLLAYREAYKKGAIRFHLIERNLTLDCTEDALRAHFEKVHTLYTRGNPAILYISLKNAEGRYLKGLYVKSMDELYKYASNQVKIYKIGFVLMKAFWILPNGRVIELTSNEIHTNYVRRNPSNFNISEYSRDQLEDMGDNDVYNLAFNKGAVRIFAGHMFGVNCKKVALSSKIETIHSLYSKYARGGKVILDLVEDGGRIKGYEMNSFGELYSYASNNKIYRTAMKITIEEKDKITDLVNRIKKGYTNWVAEDLQLYQNNAKVIEALLRGEEVNWGGLVEDEMEKELRELRGML